MTNTTALASRDLNKMLNRIANSEKLERQCRRARDSEGMFKAITHKIEEQAKYIVLRDATVAIMRSMKPGPGRGHKGKNNLSTMRVCFPRDDPGEKGAHRWRKAFCTKNGAGTEIDFKKVKLALEDARLRCLRICEQQNMGTIRGTEGTGEFERYTPAEYIEAACKVLGEIDLDPASNAKAQKTVNALKYFTAKDNGLRQEWHGRVWLNPPYHRDLGPAFVDKMVAEIEAKHVTAAIMLTNNCTDTDWFDVALKASASVCFTHGRIRFTQPNGQEVLPTQGQAFFYYGPDPSRFEEVFCKIGSCLRMTAPYCASGPK